MDNPVGIPEREIIEKALEFARIGLYRYKIDGTIEFMDKSSIHIFDLEDLYPDPYKVTGKNILEFVPAIFLEVFHKKIFEKGRLKNFEYTFKTFKGNNKWFRFDSFVIFNEAGKGEALQVIIEDITEEKETRETLYDSQARYEAIVEGFEGFIYICSRDYKVEFMNKKFIERTGYNPLETLCYKALHNLDDICPWCVNDRVFYGEKVDYEVFGLKDNRWYHIVNTPIHHSDGKISKMSIIQDITERKLAEKLLHEEKERLAVTLRSIGEGVITTDTEGKVLLINKTGEKLTGWNQEEAEGKVLHEVFVIVDEKTQEKRQDPVSMAIKLRCLIRIPGNTLLISRDGNEKLIYASGAPIFNNENKIIGVVIVFQDVTIQKKIEEEALKSSKFESLALLAGGIAHDFNNSLTAILGNITLAKMYIKPKDEIHQILVEAEKATYRAKDLTQQLLTLSKGGTPVKKAFSIAELLKDTTYFTLRGSSIECDFHIPDNLWPVEVDHGQISQVINNLIINAMQSMPGGGIITVSAENMVNDKIQDLPLKKDKYIKISIQDYGTGIKKENLSKIFDPYFTTKAEGSGLGLTTTYSIIKKHKGHIAVESKVSKGTTFYIYLPATEEKIKKKRSERTIKGGGKILLMDDEEVILKTTGKILKRLGYDVEFAGNGREVLEVYKEGKKSGKIFDVFILDLTIPGGPGGQEALQELIRLDPGIKAIASSGYPDHPAMADFKKYGFKAAIAKPYKISDLSKILHRLINY